MFVKILDAVMIFLKRMWLGFWSGFPLFFVLMVLISVARGEIFGYPAARSEMAAEFAFFMSPILVYYFFRVMVEDAVK